MASKDDYGRVQVMPPQRFREQCNQIPVEVVLRPIQGQGRKRSALLRMGGQDSSRGFCVEIVVLTLVYFDVYERVIVCGNLN